VNPSFFSTLRALTCLPYGSFTSVSQSRLRIRALPLSLINDIPGVSTDPYILPMVRVDRGAIRFLLAGAHMMCPGLTSAGGYLPPPDAAIPAGNPVAIHAEGKDHAVGIGITKLSSEEMRKVNKGVGVEIVTYLGDDLWALQTL
jgi:predicted RNA-binding protein (TIGR00451 family)